MQTGWKLVIGGGVIAGVTAYMAYVGASSSWQYYVNADECLASSAELVGDRIRVSGKVASGTLQIAPDRNSVSFSLEAAEGQLPVVCTGTLPDNLAEGIDVVVEGHLETANLLRGDKLLTRCASKYESEGAADPSGSPRRTEA
jgi:cytochrome c-type biogenesis protein CcmE